MKTIMRIIISCLSLAISVQSYGYGMFGRGPWMSPFRPYLPSPFMSPFTSGFAAGFGSGFGGGAGAGAIPAAGLGLNLGLGGGFGPGMGMGGFGLKRAGFSPLFPSPAFAGIGMGGIPVPAAAGISPFGASPFAAASTFRPITAFPPPAFSYPFTGFGSRATFGAMPLMPAPITASALTSSSSMGSYASSSKPQFTVMKLGSSSSSSSSGSSPDDYEIRVSSDPKEVTVAEGISDQDLVAEATGRRKYIYGFKGRKYYVGKPWDVFSKK